MAAESKIDPMHQFQIDALGGGDLGDGRAGRVRRCALPTTAFLDTPIRRPISACFLVAAVLLLIALPPLATKLGLDRPAPERYLDWVAGLLTGRLGDSFAYSTPVADLILERLSVTVPLALLAMALTCLVALCAGVFAAMRHNRLGDVGLMGLTQVGIAIPNFWFAILLILLLVPFWTSYLLRVMAWKLMLGEEGEGWNLGSLVGPIAEASAKARMRVLEAAGVDHGAPSVSARASAAKATVATPA